MYLASTKNFPKFPIPARREREGEVFPLYILPKDLACFAFGKDGRGSRVSNSHAKDRVFKCRWQLIFFFHNYIHNCIYKSLLKNEYENLIIFTLNEFLEQYLMQFILQTYSENIG